MLNKQKVVMLFICFCVALYLLPQLVNAKDLSDNKCRMIYQLVFDEFHDSSQPVIICSDGGKNIKDNVLRLVFKFRKRYKAARKWFSNTGCQKISKNYLNQQNIIFKTNKQINEYLKEDISIGKTIMYFSSIGFRNENEAFLAVGVLEKTDRDLSDEEKASMPGGRKYRKKLISIGYLVYLQKVNSMWQIKLAYRAWW